VKLDNSHRIYDSFFKIENIDAIVHPMSMQPRRHEKAIAGPKSL